MKKNLNSNPRHLYNKIWEWIFKVAGGFSVILLLGIFLFLIFNAVGILGDIPVLDFLFGKIWNPGSYHGPQWGTLSLITGTFMVAFLALIVATPLGIGIAIYLSEIASSKVREILKPVIEMMASIPSVVLGLLGLIFLAPLIAKIFHLPNGLNCLTVSLLVAFAALPTIASISEDALSSVSNRFREASLALGATDWMTVKNIVIPAAASGLVAAVMLGFGRVIGETMIVLMVAGNSLAFPSSFLDPVRPMTANIAIEIREVVVNSLHWQALFAIGLVLFLMTFLVNFIVDIWLQKKSI